MSRNLTRCQLCGQMVGVKQKGRKVRYVNLDPDKIEDHNRTCPGLLHDTIAREISAIVEAGEKRRRGRPRKHTPDRAYLKHQVERTFAFLNRRSAGRCVRNTIPLEDTTPPDSGGAAWN